MSDIKTNPLPALTRDDLWVNYGPTGNLLFCPACDASPGFDANGTMVGEDVRWLAMIDPDGRRLCDPCAKRIAGPEIADILEAISDLDADLYGIHKVIEEDPSVGGGSGMTDLLYASQVATAGVRLVIAGLSRMFNVPDTINRDVIVSEDPA